jgi:putative transcriptional regulator
MKLKKLIDDREFHEGRPITLAEIAEATGVHRMTLSRLNNPRGYSTSTDTLNRLCEYFNCAIEDLIEYVPDSEVQSRRSGK